MMEASNNDNMLIYRSEDGKIKIDVRFESETVWLSLDRMATLFWRDKSTISRHVKNIFEEGELQAASQVTSLLKKYLMRHLEILIRQVGI